MFSASLETRLMWICPEVSIKGTDFSRNRILNMERVGDTCEFWCYIICHQYMAAWKFKVVENFDYKVHFLLLYLCPVHLVNASSSSNSKEGRPVCQAGVAQALLPCSTLASFTTCLIFLLYLGW